MPRSLLTCLLALALASSLQAQQPTLANVAYGQHERQVLDFYQAKSAQPQTPLLFYIHGGGWMAGDKGHPDFLQPCLESGISVVSIHYRLIPQAIEAKIDPPLKACLDDAARALQFVRSKAAEWHIDKARIGGCGGSAGAYTALWLGFHPDLAEPASADPIARESTRLRCVMAFVPQTTLDPKLVLEWIPNATYGNHAFGLGSIQELADKRDKLLPWIERLSPYSLVSADDPPVLLFYDTQPNLGQPCQDPTHSANYGAAMAPKLKAAGVEHEIHYNNSGPELKWPDLFGFIREKLLGDG